MENEKELLLAHYKQAKDGKTKIRYLAVLKVKIGMTLVDVASFLLVDQQSIHNWVAEWDKSQTLQDRDRSGRPKTITKELEEEITRLVDKNNPSDEGLHVATWDCRELRIWLKTKHTIQVTDECIRKILIKNKFHYRKLNYKFTKADDTKKAEFLKNFQDLHAHLEGTVIFQDEMASKLHPNKGRIWTREKKPFIETECSHKKQYVIGGISPQTGESYTLVEEKFNAKTFIEWMKLVLNSVLGNVFIVMDNHPSHHSKAARAFLDNNPRIVLLFLPAYSPDLNPQENFWNYLRKKFLNHKIFKNVEEMKKGIIEFIQTISKETVKSVCSYQYLLP